MSTYFRPIAQHDAARSPTARPLAGGWCWFDHVEILERGRPARVVPAGEIPRPVLAALTTPRATIAGLQMDRAQLMGILNVTPDSFSDGGHFAGLETALRHAQNMIAQGADIIDIGGESTRPGAREVPAEVEVERTAPVIRTLAPACPVPISIDTRKAGVARAALAAGASILNDVSALSFDAQLAEVAVKSSVPVCLMHSRGDPETMQQDPRYDDVLLDVYDALAERISAAEAAGIPRDRIIVDPGIGFGKTLEHNLALLRRLELFHALGCPILLGASRKRFIGTLSGQAEAAERVHGSVAVALAGIAKGVQIVRIHDVGATRQALTLWQAATGMGH